MVYIALALATSFGVGYVPVAPGTFGSLVGLLLWWLLPHTLITQLVVVVGLFAVGTWSASEAERHFGDTDPGPVVIDEVMGMLATLVLAPESWLAAGLGFFLFRASDIVKPYPANRLERLHGGVGIMADDLMAAVYANLALRVLLVMAAWVSR